MLIRRLGWVTRHAVVVVSYVLSGVLAFLVFPIGEHGAGLWPAAGVSVAAALLLGPSAALSTLVGDALLSVWRGFPVEMAALLALAAAVEALIARYLLTRVVCLDPSLERQKDVIAFITLGVVPAAIVCVALRLLLTQLSGQGVATTNETLIVGVLGHALGILMVAPVILTRAVVPPASGGHAERAALAMTALAANAAAFTVTPVGPGTALLYGVFIVMLWAAVRFGPRETTGVLLFTGASAAWAAATGAGPFLVSSLIEALFSLTLFLLVASGTALLVAAAAREREKSLQRVHSSERAYRSLVEQMNEGVAVIGAGDSLNFVSERFCSLLRSTRDRLIGRTLLEVVGEAERPILLRALEAAIETGEGQCEIRVARGHAAPALVAVTLRRLTDGVESPGEPAIMAVFADITEERRAADLARLQLQQLAHQGRVQSMSEMATAFAHEIAQPLTAVTSYAQAARRFLDADCGSIGPASKRSPLHEALDGVESEARRGADIVRRIRGFVQHHAREPVVLSIEELIGDVARLAAPEASMLDARLEVSQCGHDCQVRVDSVQIQQVILNLVRNATEAMAQAGSAVRVVGLQCDSSDRSDAGSGWLDIRITDTGPGVSDTDLDRIFEPFVTSKPDGLGIGLALCRSIVEAHGGRLWAERRTAGGACFRFTLPEVGDA